MRIATLLFILAVILPGYAASAADSKIKPIQKQHEIDIMAVPFVSIKAIPACRPLPKKITTEYFGKGFSEKDGWKILWMDLNGDGVCDGILQRKDALANELAPHFPRLIPAAGWYLFSKSNDRFEQLELGDGQRNGWISIYYAEPNKPPFIIHYLKDVGRFQPSMYVILRGDQRYIEYAAGGITAYKLDHEESDGFIARHYLLLSSYYQDWRKRTKKRDKNIEQELFAMEANILEPEFVKTNSKNPTQ